MNKVVIVDDNQNFVSGLVKYLSRHNDILVLGTAFTAEQAVKLPEMYNFDVMVLDINLNNDELDGILVAKQICKSQNTKIIMLTDYNNIEFVRKSMAFGAVYYLLKTNYKILPEVIRVVNNSYLTLKVIFDEYYDMLKDKELREKFLLSETETKIYKLIESGKNRLDIINEFYITDNTYKKHIGSILKKINAKTMSIAKEKFEQMFLK